MHAESTNCMQRRSCIPIPLREHILEYKNGGEILIFLTILDSYTQQGLSKHITFRPINKHKFKVCVQIKIFFRFFKLLISFKKILSGINTQWSSSLWTWGGGWETRPQTTTWTHPHWILFQGQICRGVPVCGHEVGGEGQDHRRPHEYVTTLVSSLGINMQWSSSLWTWGGGWGTRPQTTTWIRDNFSILFRDKYGVEF